MRRRHLTLALTLILVSTVGIPACSTWSQVSIGAGYLAAWMCSGIFISGRTPDDMRLQEFGPETNSSLELYSVEVDAEARTVRASLWGMAPALAVYREGLGCTLVHDREITSLRDEIVTAPAGETSADLPWPDGEAVDLGDVPDTVSRGELDAVLAEAFRRPAHGPDPRTRAVVVVHRGRIVAERSVAPYTVHTPLYGASMSKTVTAMLIGVLVQRGRLSLEQNALRPEWSRDRRREITLDHLLRMSSGLRFVEKYTGASDVNRMLFEEPDMPAFAASLPLEAEPGTRWSYSSGTSNLLMALARASFGGDDQAYWRFPSDALFGPLGCRSAVFQTDTAGTFVGSSYVFASARDWARLGLLLLRDGTWRGRRMLPEGWVDYMRTPAPADRAMHYGAQTWLEGATRPDELAPIFEMNGHGGQFVTIVPAADLVVVRLGWQNLPDVWNQRAFVDRIIGAIAEVDETIARLQPSRIQVSNSSGARSSVRPSSSRIR